MSEWEDFCGSNGWDVGSEEDNNRFLDSLKGDDEYDEEDESAEPRFITFKEALNWSKQNGGEAFTRTVDGRHFMPAKNKSR